MPGVFYPDARVTLGVVLESIEDDNAPFAFPVRPEEISIFRNSYREADTFSVQFNATHLPLTPEVLRASSAEIYLFHKSSLSEQPESVTNQDNSQLAIDGTIIQPAIVGLVDEADMDYDDSGRMVSLSGRDYTALYLDTDWDSRTRMTIKGPLDTVLQKIADKVPGSNGVIKVRVEPKGQSMPVVGKGETRANRKGLVFPHKANFWEVMLALAVRYGFIIFVKGTSIILTKPNTYLEGKTGSLAMAWGKNLHDIHMKRKLGKERVPIIEMRSYVAGTNVPLVARFPSETQTKKELREQNAQDKAERKALDRYIGKVKKKKKKRKPGKNATGLGTAREEISQYVISGVTSKKQLEEIAEQAYHQLGRSEMTVQLSTSDLTDLEGAPLLDISSGDAMQVKFDPFNDDLTYERIERELIDRGYAPEIAAKLSRATQDMNELRSPMRVDSATIDFDLDDGITITATLEQFVNIFVQADGVKA